MPPRIPKAAFVVAAKLPLIRQAIVKVTKAVPEAICCAVHVPSSARLRFSGQYPRVS